MKSLTTPILYRCCEHVEGARRVAMQVKEDGPASEVFLNSFNQIFPDGFKKRMSGRDPFESRVLLENCFVEDDLPILSRQPAKPELQPIAGR